jgi:hypothetical protein
MRLAAVWIDFQGMLEVLASLCLLPFLNQESAKIHPAHDIVRMSQNGFREQSSGRRLLPGGDQKIAEGCGPRA